MSQHSDRGDGRGKGEKAGERTTKVSLKDAKMWHTPKMSSPSRTLGPRVVFSPSAPFLGGCGGEQTRNRGFREHTGRISQRAAPPAAAAFRGKEVAFALQARQTRRGDTRLRALCRYPSGAGSVPCFRRGATLQCLRAAAATGRENEEALMLSRVRSSAFYGEGYRPSEQRNPSTAGWPPQPKRSLLASRGCCLSSPQLTSTCSDSGSVLPLRARHVA